MLYREYEIIISTLCKDFISTMYFYFICLNKQRLFWYGVPKIRLYCRETRWVYFRNDYKHCEFFYSLRDGNCASQRNLWVVVFTHTLLSIQSSSLSVTNSSLSSSFILHTLRGIITQIQFVTVHSSWIVNNLFIVSLQHVDKEWSYFASNILYLYCRVKFICFVLNSTHTRTLNAVKTNTEPYLHTWNFDDL